jgi:hypothetical protein
MYFRPTRPASTGYYYQQPIYEDESHYAAPVPLYTHLSGKSLRTAPRTAPGTAHVLAKASTRLSSHLQSVGDETRPRTRRARLAPSPPPHPCLIAKSQASFPTTIYSSPGTRLRPPRRPIHRVFVPFVHYFRTIYSYWVRRVAHVAFSRISTKSILSSRAFMTRGRMCPPVAAYYYYYYCYCYYSMQLSHLKSLMPGHKKRVGIISANALP